MNMRELIDRGAVRPQQCVLINCRPDRIDANRQMAGIVPELRAEKLFLIGHPTWSVPDAIPSRWNGAVVDLGGGHRPADAILDAVHGDIDREASLLAVGNVHGQGELLLDRLARM